MAQPPVRTRNPVAAHPFTSAIIAILIIATIFFALYVPLYARATPKVGPFPFFYFYLLVYMIAVAPVLWVVILLQKRLAPPGSAPSAAAAASTGEVTR
jgi:hypothetical protein